MEIFDSHAHLISADRERYPPAPLSGTLRAGEFDDPVTVERLLGLMDAQGVTRALAVQRAHVYGFNNAYVLDAAECHPNRIKAMCMLNALDPSAQSLVRHWIRNRGVAGIRLTEPSKGADASWFASDQALGVWRAVSDLGGSMRLHFYRWNRDLCLAALTRVLEAMPDAIVVLDHLSNITAIARGPDFGVDAALLDFVRFPNVKILFSTINLARMKADGVPAMSVVERVVRSFGAERVMWGSDIGQSSGTYADMLALAREAVGTLSASQQSQVLRDSARDVYWPASP
jgi:L-fuconolactonase